jgi:hypothetical protein
MRRVLTLGAVTDDVVLSGAVFGTRIAQSRWLPGLALTMVDVVSRTLWAASSRAPQMTIDKPTTAAENVRPDIRVSEDC